MTCRRPPLSDRLGVREKTSSEIHSNEKRERERTFIITYFSFYDFACCFYMNIFFFRGHLSHVFIWLEISLHIWMICVNTIIFNPRIQFSAQLDFQCCVYFIYLVRPCHHHNLFPLIFHVYPMSFSYCLKNSCWFTSRRQFIS